MTAIRNPENATLICVRLADGFTLRQIGKELDCSIGSITDWCEADADFAARYARAMDLRYERMAEEIQEISDEGTNDWMEREGVTIVDHEHIQRSKLRVDTRKWLLSKMRPRQFGDRTTVAGDPDAPLNVAMTIEDKRAATKAVLDLAFGPRDTE